MKTKKLAFAAAAAATLVLGACGNNNDSSGSTESDEIVTELSEDTTVTFLACNEWCARRIIDEIDGAIHG